MIPGNEPKHKKSAGNPEYSEYRRKAGVFRSLSEACSEENYVNRIFSPALIIHWTLSVQTWSGLFDKSGIQTRREDKTRQAKHGWDNQCQKHNIIFLLHVSMDWTSKMRQGMQNLVWECWNEKGLNNTAVSEIVKLRASFPGVLINFLPTTENMAKAMWSWIKSSIGDAFAKAPSTASAVWKLLVGFDIHAKFLFIHITRRSWYRPNLLLAENRAALLVVHGNFKSISPCFPWETGRGKPKLSKLGCPSPLLLPSCSIFTFRGHTWQYTKASKSF